MPTIYELDVPWPAPVDDARAISKFIKSKKKLQVRAPLSKAAPR